jgi:hypothetical protein
MPSYEDDNMSFYSDDAWNTYDPTICACSSVGERPVEECGRCLEYYTMHDAARVVSAMDSPTPSSMAIEEIGMLIRRFQEATVEVNRTQAAVALILCVERYPDFMMLTPALRETMYDRCNAWVVSSPEILADCDHCREFLGSLRSRPGYIWSQREEIDSMAALMQEGSDDWAVSTAERLTVD